MSDTVVKEKAAGKPKAKRLSPKEYSQAKSMWKSGGFTLEQISKKVGVTGVALQRRFKKDGIVKGSNAASHERALTERFQDNSVREMEEQIAIAKKLKTENLKYVDALTKRAMQEVAQAIKGEKKLDELAGIMKTIHEVSKIVSLNYSTASGIIGIDKLDDLDDKLPELVVYEMSAEDVQNLRDQQESDELNDGVGSSDEFADFDDMDTGDVIEEIAPSGK